jgi:uncharacterized membrane protein
MKRNISRTSACASHKRSVGEFNTLPIDSVFGDLGGKSIPEKEAIHKREQRDGRWKLVAVIILVGLGIAYVMVTMHNLGEDWTFVFWLVVLIVTVVVSIAIGVSQRREKKEWEN